MKPDPKRFSRLLFIISSIFILTYLAFSMRRLYVAHHNPESVHPDSISPMVDIAVIATVVVAYAVFMTVRYFKGREERSLRQHYARRKK